MHARRRSGNNSRGYPGSMLLKTIAGTKLFVLKNFDQNIRVVWYAL